MAEAFGSLCYPRVKADGGGTARSGWVAATLCDTETMLLEKQLKGFGLGGLQKRRQLKSNFKVRR